MLKPEERRNKELVSSVIEILRSIAQSLHIIQVQLDSIRVEEQPDPKGTEPRPPVRASVKLQLPVAITEYYEAEQESKSRLKWWRRIKGAAEIIGIAAGVWYAYTTYGMWHTMQKQTQAAIDQVGIMQKQFEAADRPWISLRVAPASPLTYDNIRGVSITFNFTPENIGRSPAENVSIVLRLTPATMGNDISGIQKSICANRAAAKDPFLPGYVLFPQHSYLQQIGIGISPQELDSYWSKFERSQGPIDLIPVVLVGCVDYTFEASSAHHQTGFAFDILMSDKRIVLKSKTPLAPGNIFLMQHPTGGYFAN